MKDTINCCGIVCEYLGVNIKPHTVTLDSESKKLHFEKYKYYDAQCTGNMTYICERCEMAGEEDYADGCHDEFTRYQKHNRFDWE